MNRRAGRLDDLGRHIMRARRRGESAAVLVARAAGAHRSTGRLLAGCFRVTDSVSVVRLPRGYALSAVFDDDGLDRAVLERRLRASAGVPMQAAWARFPDDGVTLDALLERAWAELHRSDVPDPAQAIARVPA